MKELTQAGGRIRQAIADVQARKDAEAQAKALQLQTFREEVAQSEERFEREIKPALLRKIDSLEARRETQVARKHCEEAAELVWDREGLDDIPTVYTQYFFYLPAGVTKPEGFTKYNDERGESLFQHSPGKGQAEEDEWTGAAGYFTTYENSVDPLRASIHRSLLALAEGQISVDSLEVEARFSFSASGTEGKLRAGPRPDSFRASLTLFKDSVKWQFGSGEKGKGELGDFSTNANQLPELLAKHILNNDYDYYPPAKEDETVGFR